MIESCEHLRIMPLVALATESRPNAHFTLRNHFSKFATSLQPYIILAPHSDRIMLRRVQIPGEPFELNGGPFELRQENPNTIYFFVFPSFCGFTKTKKVLKGL